MLHLSILQQRARCNRSRGESSQFRANGSYGLTGIFFLLDFCGRPRNGLALQALTGVFVTFRTHDAALSFDTSTVTGVRPRILSRFAGVPRSVPGCPIDFLPLRSLSLAQRRARLENAWRKRIRRSRAAHGIPFKLWPRGRQFRLFRNPLSPAPGATFRRNL